MTDDNFSNTLGLGGKMEDLAQVDLEFATLRRFREEMAPFLNYQGFFVRTDDPFARGTRVRFRFLLPEGFALAEGTGVVSWTRTKQTHKREEPGMAVWFEEVKRQSKEVVDELVDFHIATGGTAFDLGGTPEPAGAGEIPTDSLDAGYSPKEDLPAPPPATSEPAGDDMDFGELPDPPPSSEPVVEAEGEAVLPDWLSKVQESIGTDPSQPQDPVAAQDSETPPDDDFETRKIESTPSSDTAGRAEPTPDTSELESAIRDMPLSADDDLEVSLVPDGEGFETPSRPGPTMPDDDDPVITAPERRTPLRGVRVKSLLTVTAILAVCMGAIYWVAMRTINQPVEPTASLVEPGTQGAEEDGLLTEQLAEPFDDQQGVVGEGDGEAPPEEEGVDFEITGEVSQTEPEPEQQQPQAASPGNEMIPAEFSPAVDGTATRLLAVSNAVVDGATQVSIRGNGQFLEGRVRVMRLENPARVWIRIKNIGTFYRPNEIPVNSRHVERIRIGHHPEESPPSIYVVLDLATDRAKVQETWLEGDTFRVAVDIK
ncbi:MAG: hypothetical protein PVG92_07690 [Holophagae bacterium]|jgi:uncharacterized protein (TIGR02266 family)